MKKRFISAALSAAIVISSAFAATAVPAEAAEQDYGLAQHSAEGVILHCFDWSFNTIKENLPEIAAAGYTTIQTSPVQQPKDYGPWSNSEDQWWKLYQPVSFTVATKDSWLGTKDELTALCAEAEKYGIKVICDIVSNHMGNLDGDHYLSSNYKNLSPLIETYEPDIYADYTKYFHTTERDISDTKLQYLVQGEMNRLPDLNTSEEYVQSRVISLLKECIDCGVDGFRFDAAKHIETPADGSYASEFWPNVIGAAEAYAAEKGTELYCYGEVLNTPGKGREISDYTKYIHVTDNRAGNSTLSAVRNKRADLAEGAQGYNYKDEDPSNLVLWAESHDTYMDNSTRGVSNDDIVKAWAIVAARGKSQSLYLARPSDLMGYAGDSTWKSTVVSEVNKFHNHFIGTDDTVYSDGSVLAVQRGDSGIVLVNLGDTDDISVTTKGLKDGTYTDTVSGSTFTVSGGVVTGKTGSTGVAVLYEGAALTPNVSFSAENISFKTATFKLTLTAENAQSATYSIDGAAPVSFTDTVDLVLGEGVEEGKTITVKTVAVNGDKTVEETHTYLKEVVNHSGVTVYFRKSNSKNWDSVFIYAFYDKLDENGKKVLDENGQAINLANNGNWPGVKMDYDAENDIFFYEVPADIPLGKGYVIFTDGKGNQTKDLRLNYETSIYSDERNRLLEYDPNGTTLTYGDVTNDGDIKADDALAILRFSSLMVDFTDAQKAQADVDGDKDVTANDALFILRASVAMTGTGLTGQQFLFTGTGAVTPSEPEDSDTDTAAKPTTPTDGELFYVINGKNGSAGLFLDGCKVWIGNNETGEVVETTKSSDDDTAAYAYAAIPSTWKKITLYRTAWSDNDVSSAYNSWNVAEKKGDIPDGMNAVQLKGENLTFKNFDPNA